MNRSKIEWTESTWNPVTGCTKISEGCAHCYAERMALRLKAMGQKNYVNGFKVTMHQDTLQMPLSWRKPQNIFVNSMSDLFHEDLSLDFVQDVFETMKKAHWHRFQILTKRAERLLELSEKLNWSENIWMGVTVESYHFKHRIESLRNIPAQVKFLSLEPLLTSLGQINFDGINWVIVGGESGPKSRPIQVDWVREIRDQCIEKSIPFFFKQWGGVQKKKNGRILDDVVWDEMPLEELTV